MTEKKIYIEPQLNVIGEVEELTQGEGLRGDDDQWWFIQYGTDPASG